MSSLVIGASGYTTTYRHVNILSRQARSSALAPCLPSVFRKAERYLHIPIVSIFLRTMQVTRHQGACLVSASMYSCPGIAETGFQP